MSRRGEPENKQHRTGTHDIFRKCHAKLLNMRLMFNSSTRMEVPPLADAKSFQICMHVTLAAPQLTFNLSLSPLVPKTRSDCQYLAVKSNSYPFGDIVDGPSKTFNCLHFRTISQTLLQRIHLDTRINLFYSNRKITFLLPVCMIVATL